MTLEDKKLVYKDLCCRLPYNVKIKRSWIAPMTGSPEETITTFSSFDVEVLSTSIELNGADGFVICDDGKTHTVRNYSCLPYLRPLTAMSDKERYELRNMFNCELDFNEFNLEILDSEISRLTYQEIVAIIDYLNAHYFDYNDLISKGLALKAGPDENHITYLDFNLLYPITDEKLLKEDTQYKLQQNKKPDVIYDIKKDN